VLWMVATIKLEPTYSIHHPDDTIVPYLTAQSADSAGRDQRSYITNPRLTIGAVDIRIAVEAVKYWRTERVAILNRAYH